MTWKEFSLGSIGEFINGINFTSAQMGHGYRLINVKDIFSGNGKINFELLELVNLEITPKLVNYFTRKNDLFFVRSSVKRDGIGLVGIARQDDSETVHCGFIIRLRVTNKDINSLFLTYLLRSPLYRSKIINLSSGAAIINLSQKNLSTLKILIPPLKTQEAIADILSKYDDLIENNRRRIELLEESARLLYREWFVYFRFPGHEHTPIIDGIPQGWEQGTVSTFYKTTSGGTPSRKNPDFFTGNINWVKTQELNNGFIFETQEKITDEAIKSSSAKLFPEKTVLVAMYGATIGETAILASPAASNQACCALLPQVENANYIFSFLFLRDNKQGLINLSQGAAQNNINQDIIKSFPMLLPDKKIMLSFLDFTEPIFEQIRNISLQNQKLQEARDILLPRLMSGEIAV